jgi:hypothetical protein
MQLRRLAMAGAFAVLTAGLSACVYEPAPAYYPPLPPPYYGYSPSYYYAPGYYAAPAARFSFFFGGGGHRFGGHRRHWR